MEDELTNGEQSPQQWVELEKASQLELAPNLAHPSQPQHHRHRHEILLHQPHPGLEQQVPAGHRQTHRQDQRDPQQQIHHQIQQ